MLAKFTSHTEITLEELDQQIATFDNAYSVGIFANQTVLNLTNYVEQCRTLQRFIHLLAQTIPNFTRSPIS